MSLRGLPATFFAASLMWLLDLHGQENEASAGVIQTHNFHPLATLEYQVDIDYYDLHGVLSKQKSEVIADGSKLKMYIDRPENDNLFSFDGANTLAVSVGGRQAQIVSGWDPEVALMFACHDPISLAFRFLRSDFGTPWNAFSLTDLNDERNWERFLETVESYEEVELESGPALKVTLKPCKDIWLEDDGKATCTVFFDMKTGFPVRNEVRYPNMDSNNYQIFQVDEFFEVSGQSGETVFLPRKSHFLWNKENFPSEEKFYYTMREPSVNKEIRPESFEIDILSLGVDVLFDLDSEESFKLEPTKAN